MTGKKEINPYTIVTRMFSSKVKPTPKNLAAVDLWTTFCPRGF